MEPLWSPVVANSGNHSQNGPARNWRKQAETVAIGCSQLPPRLDGKEGVDGSSPSEGSAKAPHAGAFPFRTTCSSSNVQWVWSPLWSPQVDRPCGRGRSCANARPAPEFTAACVNARPDPGSRLYVCAEALPTVNGVYLHVGRQRAVRGECEMFDGVRGEVSSPARSDDVEGQVEREGFAA